MNWNELGLIKLKLNSTKIFLIFPKLYFILFKFKNLIYMDKFLFVY